VGDKGLRFEPTFQTGEVQSIDCPANVTRTGRSQRFNDTSIWHGESSTALKETHIVQWSIFYAGPNPMEITGE